MRMIPVLFVALIEAQAHAALYWTAYASEETGPVRCAYTEGAVGFACTGDYCDNVALLCETLPNDGLSSPYDGTMYNTPYFSEENDGYTTYFWTGWYRFDNENYDVCHNNQTYPGLVGGISCTGSYCDNISLECRQPIGYVNGVYRNLQQTNCAWSGWYSEEQGAEDFGVQRYIMGVECSGDYCDNKRFYVCSLY